jgi:hypothetical protein
VYIYRNEAVYGSVAYITEEARLLLALQSYSYYTDEDIPDDGSASSLVVSVSGDEAVASAVSYDSDGAFVETTCDPADTTDTSSFDTNIIEQNYASGRGTLYFGLGARYKVKDT